MRMANGRRSERDGPAPGSADVEIDATVLKRWLEDEEAILVDVREPDEHAAERIPGAHLVPLSRFRAADVPPGRRIVLHCRSGRRSAQALGLLRSSGRAEVTHLRGGILAWKKAGHETERAARAPVSIMRQVQIVVGTLLLAATGAAVLVSPWFVALAGVLGAGLLFAGVTGTCGLASVLVRMPWNRALRPDVGCGRG